MASRFGRNRRRKLREAAAQGDRLTARARAELQVIMRAARWIESVKDAITEEFGRHSYLLPEPERMKLQGHFDRIKIPLPLRSAALNKYGDLDFSTLTSLTCVELVHAIRIMGAHDELKGVMKVGLIVSTPEDGEVVAVHNLSIQQLFETAHMRGWLESEIAKKLVGVVRRGLEGG